MVYNVHTPTSPSNCNILCSIIKNIITTVTLIIFACVLLDVGNILERGLTGSGDRGKNGSSFHVIDSKDCQLHYVFFGNDVNAVFCEQSPAPVVFYKKGSSECSVPVLVLQAMVLSISYNSTAFHQLFKSLKIGVVKNNRSDLVIHLPCGIQLAPDGTSLSAKLDFIGKLHRLSRVGGT